MPQPDGNRGQSASHDTSRRVALVRSLAFWLLLIGAWRLSNVPEAISALRPSDPDGQMARLLAIPWFESWAWRTSVSLELVIGIGFVLGALGMLRWKPWARRLTIGVSVLSIIDQTVAGIVLWAAFQSLPLQEGIDPTRAMRANIIAAVSGAAISLPPPVIALIVLTRERVKALFVQTRGSKLW